MREKARNSSFIRRLLSIFAALAMVLTMGVGSAIPAMAAGDTGTITINPPAGTASNTQTEYKVYKVFDATVKTSDETKSVSYTLLSGKSTSDSAWTDSSMGTYFSVSAAGNVTALDAAKDSSDSSALSSGAVTAIAAYVKALNLSPTYTLSATGTTAVTQSDVPYGYWYVTTQTGTAVSIGTNNPNATINDKNVIPEVTKKITAVEDNAGSITSEGKAAIAQVDKKVTYTSTVTFNKGSKVIAFHDTMDSTLTFDGNSSVTVKILRVNTSNNTSTDVTNSINHTGKGVSGNTYETNPYAIKGTPDTGDTLTITFPDDLDKQAGENEVIRAEISYTATVNSTALTVNPAKNDAYVTYGDNNARTTEVNTEVYNALVSVVKHDGSGSNLAGAVFALKNSEGKYYKYTAATTGDNPTPASISWVDSVDDATKLTSRDTDGKAVSTNPALNYFVGLPNGTYTLTETTTPAGYRTAADTTVTINGVGEVTYTVATTVASEPNGTDGAIAKSGQTIKNLNQGFIIVNEAGSALPHTGGIGTTIFYVIGGCLVAAAAVILIARKRRRA